MNNEATLKKIDDTLRAIQRFDDLDKHRDIISTEEFAALNLQRENLGKLRHKLATNELEVAVVGLEKAGKSKFSSAFVNKPGLFPSADERCTFTSTALRYGDQDMARVEFYARQEFKEKVAGMLKDVEYPDSNFEQVALETFRRHFDALNETNKALYNLHASKTETDIIDILEGKSRILPLLGKETQEFHDLSAPELQSYITDKHVSRAVRSVTFYSKELHGLENIVLYDVPGFDSPTLVHIDETKKKLQQVDAIIMVKNIKMPSLKGNEVDILVKNSDMDGIRLSDKLFVFGSYADAVESPEKLNDNKRILVGDLERSLRDRFATDRLYTGCLDPQYEDAFRERGGATQTPELKDALRRYNENERAGILSKRIYRSIEEIKVTLSAVIDRTQIGILDRQEESKIVLDLLDESREIIDKDLTKFINPIKTELYDQRKFTNRIKEGIQGVVPDLDADFIQITQEKIRSSDTRNVVNFTKLNHALRDRMATQIKEAVIDLVLDVSREDAQKVQVGIEKIILDALGVTVNHPKRQELTQLVEVFIAQETSSVSIHVTTFKPLIERFIVDLIDTMILQPLGSDARWARFMQGRADLYMLAMFSETGGLDSPYRSPLVAMVLAQKQAGDASTELVDQYQREFSRAIPKIPAESEFVTVTKQLVGSLVDIAINRMVPLSDVRKFVSELTQRHHQEGDSDLVHRVVENFGFLARRMGGNKDLGTDAQQTYLEFLVSKVQQANSEEEVTKEIVADLENLVYLFSDCVVAAMNLELPFIGAITLLTEKIREIVKSRAFRDFLAQHVRDIRCGDYERLDNQSAHREILNRLIGEMRETLRQLEFGV